MVKTRYRQPGPKSSKPAQDVESSDEHKTPAGADTKVQEDNETPCISSPAEDENSDKGTTKNRSEADEVEQTLENPETEQLADIEKDPIAEETRDEAEQTVENKETDKGADIDDSTAVSKKVNARDTIESTSKAYEEPVGNTNQPKSLKRILSEVDGSLIDAPKDSDAAVASDPEQPKSPDDTSVAVTKPVIGLRLVPLTQLLKPDLVDKPQKSSPPKPARKSSIRARKSASFIEISSDSEDNQISISSTSSDSKSDSEDEVIRKRASRRKGDAGSSKENNSTNSKLRNGSSKRIHNFKEPMSPSKAIAKAKSFSVNLEKMPNNVNKLMKCYRVNETNESALPRIESWSDADDFENMISTSKIDRVALDKAKEVEKVSPVPATTAKTKRGRRNKKPSSDEEDEEPVKTKNTKKVNGEEEEGRTKRPERMSARNAKLLTKNVIELDDKALKAFNSSESDDDDVPIKPRSTKVATRPIRNARKHARAIESESDKEPAEKKQEESKTKKDSESDKKLFKSKKNLKDDHENEKTAKNRREKSSSTEEEEQPLLPRSRRNMSKESQERSTRSKKESTVEPTTRTSRHKGKSNDLKITIKLNKKEPAKSEDSDNSSDTTKRSSIDFVESSLSDDERLLQPVKLGQKKIVTRNSTSESEAESSTSSDKPPVEVLEPEISDIDTPEDEKPLILEQKLRDRSKFSNNSAFDTLKQKIEQRKNKQKASSDELPKSLSSRRNGNDKDKGSKHNNNDHDDQSTTQDDDDAIVIFNFFDFHHRHEVSLIFYHFVHMLLVELLKNCIS